MSRILVLVKSRDMVATETFRTVDFCVYSELVFVDWTLDFVKGFPLFCYGLIREVVTDPFS